MITINPVLDEDLLHQIYSVVEEIPYGNVATYGQIASMIERDKNTRIVGKAMSLASFYGNFPCHRVANFERRLVPNWHEQRNLLIRKVFPLKRMVM